MTNVRSLVRELGRIGLVAVAVIVVTALFSVTAVGPLEERSARLDKELQARLRHPGQEAWIRVSASKSSDQLDLFYKFFQRNERLDEWLAKLYAAASAANLEMKAGDYHLDSTKQRIERYQITLPITGSYADVRSFIQAALAEMPVLSLDQLSLRRKGPNEARIEAELSFSLYLAARE